MTFRFLVLAVAALLAIPAQAFFIIQPGDLAKPVVEYFSPATGHYVMISDPEEIAKVDAGGAGHWVRTGHTFGARRDAEPNVCRFYSPQANSHFFTANPEECESLKRPGSGWTFEKMDFAIALPAGGANHGCSMDATPVWRAYNNRWRENDSNHRFTADRDTYETLVARGWAGEGVAFCALGGGRSAEHAIRLEADQVRPSRECEDESINLGGCVALNQLPRPATRIASWAPPGFVTFDPSYSPLYGDITGFHGDVHTAQPPHDAAAVAAHSFAQTLAIGRSFFGFHVSSADRTFGELASINPLHQFTTTAPAPGSPERRVFPWPEPRDSHLEIAFFLDVRSVRKLTPDGHGYGHPTLQFRDVRSGQDVYLTLGTYGTAGTAGDDYFGMDESTGRVIVSTTFREKPSFGRRLHGSYVTCGGAGSCDVAGEQGYRFRIDRASFAGVLARARGLQPHLSPAPADYLLVNYHFNNEVYRGAEIAGRLRDFTLEIYPAFFPQ